MMKLPPSLAFRSFNHQFDPSHINDKTFSILTARPYLNRIRTLTVKAERINEKKVKGSIYKLQVRKSVTHHPNVTLVTAI